MIELDAESIAAAKAAGIDLSKLLVETLHRRLPNIHALDRAAINQRWQEENREVIETYNGMIGEDGYVFSDSVRTL